MEYRKDGEAVVEKTVVKMRDFRDVDGRAEVLCEWVENMVPKQVWFARDLVRPMPTPEERERQRRREGSYNPYGKNDWMGS